MYNEYMHYTHTQKGTLITILMWPTIALCLYIAMKNGWRSPVSPILLGITLLLVILTWLFNSLTVEIDGEELRHWFGPRFWKKRYQLSDIESVEVVRNFWLYGWGIRLTPHGWLYNVSGLEAVQIQLRSGRKFRIGTDEPHVLKDAINSINAL